MKKAALYARVSTEDQNPELQVKALKDFAKISGYEIYKIYIDKITGSKSSRPELNKLMFDSRYNNFNLVIVWKLDRLGRSLKHLISIVEEWEKKKIDFICISQNFDTSTPGGKLIFQVFGAIAEFERSLISERTKLGLKHAKNVGKRGKDKKKRKKGGYYLRYSKQKKGGPQFD